MRFSAGGLVPEPEQAWSLRASSRTAISRLVDPVPPCERASSSRCPRDWKLLLRISAEPEGQIPLTHTGTLPPYTPEFKRRFRASATVVSLTAGWPGSGIGAPNGHGAMSDLSPLCAPRQTLRSGLSTVH